MSKRQDVEEVICVICKKPIKPGESTMLVDGYAHVRCVPAEGTPRKD